MPPETKEEVIADNIVKQLDSSLLEILMDYDAIGAETVRDASEIAFQALTSKPQPTMSPEEEAIYKNLDIDKTRL